MVFIGPFTGSRDYVASYTIRSRVGMDDLSHIIRGFFFRAILRRKVASSLEEENAGQ